MLDQFFHNLIDQSMKRDDHKIGFLDCLLILCATGFSLLIRMSLKEFTLLGYMGQEVMENQLHYFQNVRLVEMLASFLMAVFLFVVVFITKRSVRSAGLIYTVTLFLPSSIALGGMAGYADTVVTCLLLITILGLIYKKYIPFFAGILLSAFTLIFASDYLAQQISTFSIFEIFGFGPFTAEYTKAGSEYAILLIGCILFMKEKEIIASKRGKIVFLLLVGCICELLVPALPISICILVEILALYDSFYQKGHIYRVILLAGIHFASIYRAMLDTTFIPAYIYSILLLGLALDLVWELYRLNELGTTEKLVVVNHKEKDAKWALLIFVIFATCIGAHVRILFRHFESVDYRFCFKPWTDAFKLGGGFKAMAGDFYNYPPFYMYMMYLVSLLKMEPLYPLKIVSIIWDFFLAIGAGLCVKTVTNSQKKAILTYSLIWCLPTVAANSGLWAQCDVMYVCLTIWSLYFYAKDKPRLSMLFYAGAFSFKMQVFFVLPVYVYLWVHKKYKLYQFLYLPGLYALSCIPSWLIGGKSLKALLLLYVGQSQQEPWMLSWYWPNIYQIFGVHEFYEFFAKAGMYGAIAVTMILLYDMARRLKNTSPKVITLMMYAYSVVIPFFLPYMHERYGYLADVLAVMLFVMMPQLLPLATLQVLISYVAYACHLHEEVMIPTYIYCLPMAIMVWYVVKAVYTLEEEKNELPKLF